MKSICIRCCVTQGFLSGSVVKNLPPEVGKIPWRKEWLPTPVFLPGESHGQRSLTGYSPWDCKELDMAEVTEHECSRGLVQIRPFSVLLGTVGRTKKNKPLKPNF